MPVLFVATITFILGLICLMWSANLFVSGAASLARHLGMSTMMIGLTIVAFGTSAPEIMVSAGAALDGTPDLAVGNAIGSNIANIGLVLGVTALIARIPVAKQLLKLEIPLLLISALIAIACLWDLHLGFIDGVVLMSCALSLPFIYYMANKRNRLAEGCVNSVTELAPANPILCDNESVDIEELKLSLPRAVIYLILGLLVLLFSSDILISSATDIARHFGVSGLIIGLTIVALGTSLPELAASIASAVKGHHDIAIGNVVGSNALNIFAVMALPGLIMPTTFDSSVLFRDISVMAGLTLLLSLLVIFCSKSNNGTSSPPNSTAPASFGPAVGLGLLFCYFAYFWLIFTSVQ